MSETLATAKPAFDPSAPLCMTCGCSMLRTGACHACPQCGETSGCS